MKKYVRPTIVAFAAILLSSNAFANAADSTMMMAKQNEQLAIYHTALQYNDMPTAATALVTYLNSGGTTNYHDSLAVVYYNMNNFAGSYKLANESYTRDNKNVTALSLLADISGQTNDAKTSLEWYEKLCPLNPMPFNYYQLATKQFSLERKLECKQSLTKVLADTAAAAKQKVSLQVGQGYNESVPVLAAAYNMLGVLAFKENNTTEAKQYYTAALKAFPDFVIAKQNLDAMNKPAAGVGKKPAGKTK
ncbi:MAG: tetratricopeptide repeat protein [Chitinophagaceae bacterium]